MIEKSGLLHIRNEKVLLCRKKSGSQLLILPGGKREPGESSLECLARELREELGDRVSAELPVLIGVYTHVAADNPERILRIELFQAELSGEPSPQSEIGELIWFDEHGDRFQLAPSLRELVFPDLAAREILRWPGW